MIVFYIEFHVTVISQRLRVVVYSRGAGDPPHRPRQGVAVSPDVYAMGYLLNSSSCGRCPLAKGKWVAEDMSDSNGYLPDVPPSKP